MAKLDGETLDSYQAILRRCRDHCDGRRAVHHAVEGTHGCTEACRPHVCKPLATSSIRKVHYCLSGALSRAVRWRWITVNPLDQAEPPRGSRNEPDPPTAEQAAAILNAAFREEWWGTFLWLAMTTGARRGELCALSWDRVDLDRAVITIRTSIAQHNTRTWEKDTKSHQQRRIALDADTVALLTAYRTRCEADAAVLGVRLSAGARVFSDAIDGCTWRRPSSVSNRYVRMCTKLGWDMHLHQLRHYSATELIAAGIDVRTVAGRLGHGGGGSTTLRAYTAWVAEADQRAMKSGVRMPALPTRTDSEHAAAIISTADHEDDSPYERIAADLRGAMACGALAPGDELPTVAALRERYGVSAGTANRAVSVLKEAGLVAASRGRRATVRRPSETADS